MAIKKSSKTFRRTGFLPYSITGLVLYFAINLAFLNPIILLVTALYAATFGIYGLWASWQKLSYQDDVITYKNGPFRKITIRADELAECRYVRISLTASTHILIDTIWLIDEKSYNSYGDHWKRGIPVAPRGWGKHKKAVFKELDTWLKKTPIALDDDVERFVENKVNHQFKLQ